MATSTIFSGNSRFASDFSSVIDRAVKIATLPKTLLEQQKAALDKHTAGLVSLNSKVTQLQSSVKALAGAFGSSSWGATSTSESAVGVSIGTAPTAGSWAVKVADLGATTAFTLTGFSSASNPATDVYISGTSPTLLIDLDATDGLNDPELITLSPAGSSLQNVVDEINKKAGSKVQATMVNVGTTTAPKYQLSLQSRVLGPVDITFSDDTSTSTNGVATRGSLAEYNVNGLDLTSDSRSVTLAPGVTVELKQITSSPATIQTSQTNDSLSTSLQNFVNSYNAVLTEIGKNRGDKNAALSGDSILNTVQSAVRQLITTVGPSGNFTALTDLGIGFDKTNKLYLDTGIFKAATDDKFASLKSFFGDLDNSGLLHTLNDSLDNLTNESTGILTSAIETDEKASDAQEKHISEAQSRIDRLEQQLNAKMAAADAAIALLEQKVTYFAGMWEAIEREE